MVDQTPKTSTGRRLTVTIRPDWDPPCPMDWDCQWTLVSFNRNSVHRGDHTDYLRRTEDGRIVPVFAHLSRFRAGLAFILDYYEHGPGMYSLSGEGPRCQWDTATVAGVLVWDHPPGEMGAKTYADRAEDARRFLEEYNAWANGWVYGYDIETAEGELVGSCYGFYSPGHLSETIAEHFEPGDRVYLAGELSDVFDTRKLPAGVETVDSPEDFENGDDDDNEDQE